MAPLSLIHELARSDSFDEEWEKSRASSKRSMAIGLSVLGVIAGSILLLICFTIYHTKKRLAAVKVQPYNLPVYTSVPGAVAYSSIPSGAIYNAVPNGAVSVSIPGNTANPMENSQITAGHSHMGGVPPPAYTESRGVEEALK
jgi:hypothetical protein